MHDKKVAVSSETSLVLSDRLHIKLTMSNELGYVRDVKVLFNRAGEKPGKEGSCYLEYDEKESTENISVFSGEYSFVSLGYRTFFITLKLNNVLYYVKYDQENEEAVLTQEDTGYSFWEVFVYSSDLKTPDEVKGGIVYQIFVDTFCSENLPEHLKGKVVTWNAPPKWQPDSDGVYRNDQFYGGNIRGIISKLDYIKSLNVTVIYVSPVFKSPSSNRYDIVDYNEIDEMLGTWEDVDELHREANKRGMILIIDCVFNHSSSENPLIKEHPDMYDWKEKYTVLKCWWDYEHLAEFNKCSEEYFENLAVWLSKYKMYCDGIRLDVADSLPDFVLKFIKKNFGKYILGEVWKNAITGDFREFLYGDELDGVMNYQFSNAIYRYVRWGNYKYFREVVQGIYDLYPKESLLVSPIFLSSHDIPRIPNILIGDFMKEDPNVENIWDMEKSDYWITDGKFDTLKFRTWEMENLEIPDDKKELARKLTKLAVFLQYTLPGLPSIFAGDEAGITGYKDPTNRRTFPWGNIDETSYRLYCELGKFRAEYRHVFANSDFEIIEIDETKIAFKRSNLFFAINITNEPVQIPALEGKEVVFALDDDFNPSSYTLMPYGAIVLM